MNELEFEYKINWEEVKKLNMYKKIVSCFE